MAGKTRKDSRGYALRTGECQRADGRYSYSYTDKRGDRHSVYAPSLVELRAKEKEIAKMYENAQLKMIGTEEREQALKEYE